MGKNKISDLQKDIDELRVILNEMSTSLLNNDKEYNWRILNISEKLDVLIAEYHLLTKIDSTD